MQAWSILATPVAFFLPSTSRRMDGGKVALLAIAITVFFLFTATYLYAGGASQFLAYADALLHGQKLPVEVAQRDVGYPLLLLLGGYEIWNSILGITLIQAAFAIFMPILIYWSLIRTSPTVAFYAGLLSALSLAPIYFLKWIHHDQTYIFFMILVVAMLIFFLQSREYRFLYFFTLAALAASFSRPAGNLLFPVLIAVAYITVRGRLVHYLACLMLFVVVVALYQWHRYEIFDMRHQPSIPSYTGQQIFYNLYVNSGEFGIRLSPDLGPAMRLVTNKLREQLQPDVPNSKYMQNAIDEYPVEFSNKYILPYTPDQLIEQIFAKPNYEYYTLLASADPNDQDYLRASWEIVQAHPFYVLQFSLRNVVNYVFDPGYGHTRYNARPYHKGGLEFIPTAAGEISNPAGASQRALHEMQYPALSDQPRAVQTAYRDIMGFWRLYFDAFVSITSVLMIIAWFGVLLRFSCFIVPRAQFCQSLMFPGIDSVVASIIAVSIFLLYNTAVTAAFAEPNYRYFHFSELLRILISSFGVALLIGFLTTDHHKLGRAYRSCAPYRGASQAITVIHSHDLLAGYFAKRDRQWLLMVFLLAGVLFVWWTHFMIVRTW
jgi:hypothetical protein